MLFLTLDTPLKPQSPRKLPLHDIQHPRVIELHLIFKRTVQVADRSEHLLPAFAQGSWRAQVDDVILVVVVVATIICVGARDQLVGRIRARGRGRDLRLKWRRTRRRWTSS